MTESLANEFHNCARSQCQHVVVYSDERYCYLHEPPVFDDHNCVVLNCENWKTGETFRPTEQKIPMPQTYSDQLLADAKVLAITRAEQLDLPQPNNDF